MSAERPPAPDDPSRPDCSSLMGRTPGRTAAGGRDVSGWKSGDSPDLAWCHCVMHLRHRTRRDRVRPRRKIRNNVLNISGDAELTPCVVMSFIVSHPHCKHTESLTGVYRVEEHDLPPTLKPKRPESIKKIHSCSASKTTRSESFTTTAHPGPDILCYFNDLLI